MDGKKTVTKWEINVFRDVESCCICILTWTVNHELRSDYASTQNIHVAKINGIIVLLLTKRSLNRETTEWLCGDIGDGGGIASCNKIRINYITVCVILIFVCSHGLVISSCLILPWSSNAFQFDGCMCAIVV